jgi:NAD(P)-dependent dehydrogenase (short-subunit alcohol dehydrogenase family)
MELDLVSRVVLVTGASSGIGAAVAVGFAREGAHVAVTYRRRSEAAREVATEIARLGVDALAVELDLADDGSVVRASEEMRAWRGQIDVLVNNAVLWPEDAFSDGEVLAAVLSGTMRLTNLLLPGMRDRGWGRVVMISTNLAEDGMPGQYAYVAAKAGLHGLVRTLSREAAGDGVLVNAVLPGLTETPRTARQIPVEVLAAEARRAPSGRLSTPADVASLVLYLGSSANTHVTGELIRVTGGL